MDQMNITIIAPNGFKIYLNLPREKVEKWGNELVTLSNFSVINAIKFDFSEESGEDNISKT